MVVLIIVVVVVVIVVNGGETMRTRRVGHVVVVFVLCCAALAKIWGEDGRGKMQGGEVFLVININFVLQFGGGGWQEGGLQ